jgi:7-cyano-7-deazaguanine synthase in queuosine biosynthesis
MTHIHGRGGGRDADGEPQPVLAAPQILLAAIAFARRHRAARLVYPASYGFEAETLSRATERLLLAEQLARDEATSEHAEVEPPDNPAIDTPLFELTDQQVIELGGQLGVDFSLTWTCREDAAQPCQTCRACRRRKTAFDRAGVPDPLLGRNAAA